MCASRGASLVGGSGSFSFPEVAAMALDLASLGSVSTQSPRSASSLQGSVTSSDGTEVTAEAPDTASDEAKVCFDLVTLDQDKMTCKEMCFAHGQL